MSVLHRLPAVYWDAWDELHALGATARSSGGNPNRPGSKPPAGADRRLRASLVSAARAISDATWHLKPHELPTKPWRPVSFVQGGKLTVCLGRPWSMPQGSVTCVSCGVPWTGEHTPHTRECRGRPTELVTLWIADRWSPSPDDLAITIPHPEQIQHVCSRLSGNLGLLGTRGLDCSGCRGHKSHFPGEDDDAHVHAARSAISRARGALHDAWPVRRDVPRRCKRAGCVGEDGNPRPLVNSDGGVCRACRKRDERARKGIVTSGNTVVRFRVEGVVS